MIFSKILVRCFPMFPRDGNDGATISAGSTTGDGSQTAATPAGSIGRDLSVHHGFQYVSILRNTPILDSRSLDDLGLLYFRNSQLYNIYIYIYTSIHICIYMYIYIYDSLLIHEAQHIPGMPFRNFPPRWKAWLSELHWWRHRKSCGTSFFVAWEHDGNGGLMVV